MVKLEMGHFLYYIYFNINVLIVSQHKEKIYFSRSSNNKFANIQYTNEFCLKFMLNTNYYKNEIILEIYIRIEFHIIDHNC